MKPFVLSMKYPGFPVVEFRMINHRITHIFRKRTQNEQKNYCCIQRTTQEPSALRICSKKAFVVQIPLFCKRLGGSFTRMNSCHMLQVEYPNCFLLDMGWYQDRYIISIIQNFDWTHPVQQYETAERNQLPKLLTEAVRLVEKESQSAGAN